MRRDRIPKPVTGVKMIKKICEQCGTEFFIYPSDIKHGRGKYCSKKCYDEAQKTCVKCICRQCDAEFEACPSLIKQGKGKFCSRKCRDKSRITQVKRICKYCSKEFPVRLSYIKRGGGKFCSSECQHKWQSENLRGENSPVWKDGISFEPYCTKFNKEFKEYIRAKFGRVCFLCPKTEEENGQRLSVHHVNYNKNCGCDEDETCQFVPLCRGCNSKVNHNRPEWEAKINAMLHNKLNGWYI